MSELKIPIDRVHLTELMRNAVIVRIVSILDLASLSILELLEYNLERKEINYALSEGVIGIDKTTSPSSTFQLNPAQTMREYDILLSGDSYFYDFLNSKVRLTELGLYILDSIKGDVLKKESSSPLYRANALEVSPFNPNIME